MGAKFVNIQVHTGGCPVAEVQAAIAELFRQRMLRDGYVEITGDTDDTEDDRYALFRNDRTVREVFLRPAESGPWIAVYDEQVEFGDEETIRDITRALSSAVRGVALAVQVVDSDVLELHLYRDGERIDDYSNDPFHPEVGYTTRRRRKDFTGRPSRWRDLLVPGATPAALRAAWAARPIFAEEILKPVAPLLGLRYEEWFGAWQDAWMDWRNTRRRAEPLFPGLVRLAFRSTQPLVTEYEAQGPPQLGYVDGADRLKATVGDPLPPLHVTVSNSGGASCGLRIRLGGDALDRGLVELTGVQVAVGPHVRSRHPEVHEASLALAPGKGGVRYTALLPDVTLPAGLSERATGVTWGLHQEVLLTSQLSVTVAAVAMASGRATLWISPEPMVSDEARAVPWPIEVLVTPP